MRHFDEAVLFDQTPKPFGYEIREIAMAPDMNRRYLVLPHDESLPKKDVFISYSEVILASDLKTLLKQKILDAYGL